MPGFYSADCPFLPSLLVQTPHVHASYRRPTKAPSSSSTLCFDSLSPHLPQPLHSYSPYHHNIFRPSVSTPKQPRNSFTFNTHADPPTATLQRIKALITSSLPTSIDIGYNFVGHRLRRIPSYSGCIRLTKQCSLGRLLRANAQMRRSELLRHHRRATRAR